MVIKAIPTWYNGRFYRSRLEARWAVFFDRLHIEFEYEPQGYQIPMGMKLVNYLPDFYLRETGTWVEVKGDWFEAISGGYGDLLVSAVGNCALPHTQDSSFTSGGLLLLGSIPEERHLEGDVIPWFALIQHDMIEEKSCVVFECAAFLEFGPVVQHTCTVPRDLDDADFEEFIKDLGGFQQGFRWPCESEVDLLRTAYRAARSARFEHGETPNGRKTRRPRKERKPRKPRQPRIRRTQ